MAATTLRKLLQEEEFLVCPGVYDGVSGRTALKKGFKCMYMTGAGTVSSRFGCPDIGVAGLTDMHTNAAMISSLDPKVPVIADADTGYGGTFMCARTLKMYAQSGVAGLHIEDQIQAKRCGHLGGKELVSIEEYLSRIQAMVIAREEIKSDIVIIARSDALQQLGIDEAIKRCKAAIDIGADVAFVEGITTEEEARKVIQSLNPSPVLINMVTNGDTPNWTVSQAKDMGFKLSIHPCTSIVAASIAIGKAMDYLLEDGTDEKACEGFTPKESFMQMGLASAIALDAKVGGKFYSNV
ncbi:methylisocitrate lyase [Backusella circina FSU 941]|nr:methylisocitrate lyase [Backusella circina FSU 941]